MTEANKIYCGKCEDVLRGFPDNFFDSCVTDPPYGISFMNKHWDYQLPQVETWKEILRVLKPGAHILVACGTRTQHRMAVNIEDAGFEIRDVITWHYGSGFPKSLDISKAIDKMNGAEREVVGLGKWAGRGPLTSEGSHEGYKRPSHLNHIERLETAPATEAAKEWEGYGTALKPATEFWTLARKPISENTIAENVLKHGTGAINIDGSRVEFEPEDYNKRVSRSGNNVGFKYGNNGNVPISGGELASINSQGRFPANVIFDEFTGEILDKQTGELTIGGAQRGAIIKTKESENNCMNGKNYARESFAHQDFGGASRFFKNVEADNFQYCELCQNKLNNAHIAELNLNTIHAIVQNIVPQNVSQIVSEKSVQLVKNVEGLCDLCAMNFVQEVAQISSDPKRSQVIQDFITSSNKCFLLQNLAKFAAQMENIDTTPITTSLSKLFGYALHAIDEHIKKDTQEKVEQKSEHNRFLYTPKADNYERNKGLNGFEKKEVTNANTFKSGVNWNIDPRSPNGGYEVKHDTKHGNYHPTVKPIDLMRYLVKLITPKRGIVLDPFAGSGTTCIGAKLELINYIGIEMNEDYCKIAEARVAAWNPPKYIEQKLF